MPAISTAKSSLIGGQINNMSGPDITVYTLLNVTHSGYTTSCFESDITFYPIAIV